jgi:hypothetical protein
MDGVKPWQMAVIVIGLLGGTGLLAWNVMGGEKVKQIDELVLMDVVTGDRFVADVRGRKGVILPAKHPETQEYTLLPIAKGEDGQWRVQHLREVSFLPRERLTAIADLESGIATPSTSSVRPLGN